VNISKFCFQRASVSAVGVWRISLQFVSHVKTLRSEDLSYIKNGQVKIRTLHTPKSSAPRTGRGSFVVNWWCGTIRSAVRSTGKTIETKGSATRLGFRVPELRALRSRSIGAEAASSDDVPSVLLDKLIEQAGSFYNLPNREAGMVRRYAQDVIGFLRELARVTKKRGEVLLVVGNSCLKGIPIWNANINIAAARMLGFESIRRSERALPVSHRYLPMPSRDRPGSLGRRIRTETLISLKAS
jgi:hypothetical protein